MYDVLGDVVCGSFAVPIREGWHNMCLPYPVPTLFLFTQLIICLKGSSNTT